ncbi:hypothetical protein MPTK1_8g07180 [Marchantia polymorpha subsp. ruderalis]|uniref:Uncharacterized protein n=1 Tax=Marchantia polymorpha TaxID=3197 RepID=A0A2R6XIE5_MARPO|nr:hypothetical protein MARPO_0013s0074 [Marchantia polymorpha]BBN19000.1 hypothetical protein Mp_8g07180 [Marchantia polymorpha subsp. ruderalis]|eukprot:PTQ45846.1 hypothetical protein MARPO_0013s0074 [Marchantia polymorpha]
MMDAFVSSLEAVNVIQAQRHFLGSAFQSFTAHLPNLLLTTLFVSQIEGHICGAHKIVILSVGADRIVQENDSTDLCRPGNVDSKFVQVSLPRPAVTIGSGARTMKKSFSRTKETPLLEVGPFGNREENRRVVSTARKVLGFLGKL